MPGRHQLPGEGDPLLQNGWLSERSHTQYVGLALDYSYARTPRTPRQGSERAPRFVQELQKEPQGPMESTQLGLQRGNGAQESHPCTMRGMRYVTCAAVMTCQVFLGMTRFNLPVVAAAMQCEFKWDDTVGSCAWVHHWLL